jgi:hypothetical protein
MKKLLLVSFLTLSASLAYAGSSCGGAGCDKDGKDEKSGLTQTSITLAGSCGGGDESCDEKGEPTEKGFTREQNAVA